MAEKQKASSKEANTNRPTLMLYNSLTKQKELFISKNPNEVGMYICGVTAYDLSHIGHARAYVAFDVLFRYLKELGYKVTYVRNFTDVDDKIIGRANERKTNNPEDPLSDPLRLSDHYCDEFVKDMKSLQCEEPTHQPRVSDHMDEIRDFIGKIIETGYAYRVDGGDVYFCADKFPKYGQLSGRKVEDNRAGERVAVDSRKRHPADFALWKGAKVGEPTWDSPWGRGRPGWHIECSAMSERYLTSSFDIHGGGMDLIFPHHENELAQSCAAYEEADVGYWLHNGFVTINEEKMSKSTGNFFTIREVTKQYHPLALRYFLLSVNYNSPVNFSSTFDSSNLNEQNKSNSKRPATPLAAEILKKDFECKMLDDLHTAEILKGSLQDALKSINNELNGLKKKQEQQKQIALRLLDELEKAIKKVLDVLGLLAEPYSKVLLQLKEKALIRAEITEDEISTLIEERAVARKNKDFAKSDQVRSELTAKGISLMDLPTGTTWRPCVPEGGAPLPKANAANN